MKSSGSYGEKFGNKLPHTIKSNKAAVSPLAIEKDVYAKQEEQFK